MEYGAWVRDLGFYLAGIVVVLIYGSIGEVTSGMCVVFFGIYGGYISLVLGSYCLG